MGQAVKDSPPLPPGFVEDPPPPQGFVLSSAPPSTPPSSTAPTPAPGWKDYLPSMHTALRVGGAMAGGAIGGVGGTIAGTPLGAVPGAALGAAAGSSIGESIYQLGQHAIGAPEAPQTSGEAALSQAGAMTQGALQEGLPAAFSAKAPVAFRAGAAKNIEQALRPQGMAAKEAIQESAPEAVGRFPIAASRAGLRTKLEQLSTAANVSVNQAYNAVKARFPNTKFSSQPIINELQSEVDKSSVQGTPIVGQESKAKAYNTVINWLKQHPQFDLKEFRSVKQNWDSVVNWNKYSDSVTKDPVMAEALERAANTARNSIHSVYPSLAKADAESSLWSGLREAAKASDIRGVGIEPIAALRRYGLASAIGSGIEYERGGNPLVGAIAGMGIAKLPQTVLWDTLNASGKAQLAKFIESKFGTAGAQALGVAGSMGAQGMVKSINTAQDYLRSKGLSK